jgi:hypothetical protein
VPILKIPTLCQPKKTLALTIYLLTKWSFLRTQKFRLTSKIPAPLPSWKKRKTGSWPSQISPNPPPGLTSAEYLL